MKNNKYKRNSWKKERKGRNERMKKCLKRKRKERIKNNGRSLLTKIGRQAKGLKNEINEWKRNESMNIGGMKRLKKSMSE